jgi:hypothetical protein
MQRAQSARRRAQWRRSGSFAAAGESGASALIFFMTIDEFISLATANDTAGVGRSGRCRCDSEFCQGNARQVNMSSF